MWAVGNATQAALFYQLVYGMELVAYSGPETGNRDHHSYVLRSGAVRFVLKGAVDPDSPLADHQRRHGDGISDIALEVPDVDRCIAHARAQGATVLEEPHDVSDEHGTVQDGGDRGLRRHPAQPGRPVPATPGPTCPATSTGAAAWSGRPERPSGSSRPSTTWSATSSSATWTSGSAFYNRVMGFTNMAEFVGDDIATEYSALMSKVVANGNHRVKFPLNEPAVGKRKSQIDEYLEFYRGPGAQHLALATNDILATVDGLRANGVEFLATPDSYYTDPELRARIGHGPGADRGAAVAAASWSTATRTATCCRSSPSRSATGPRCSSSSSSGTARSASARATSRPCSRRSSASRRSAATSEGGGLMAHYQRRGRHPAQAAHPAPPAGRLRCTTRS